MKFGDVCRTKSGAPALYVDDDMCLYVSAMTNELMVTEAAPPIGGEVELPLPTHRECQAAYWGMHAGREKA